MGHREPEISGDEEGDPIWKPSNTNETRGRRRSEKAENPKLSIKKYKIIKYKKSKKYIKSKNKKIK